MHKLDRLKWIVDRSIEDIRYITQPQLDVGKLDAHKGCLNYTDLNRISSNIFKIHNVVSKYGYFADVNLLKTYWVVEDIPYLEDINVIRDISNNYNSMFQIYTDGILYTNTLTFKDLNKIEKILLSIKTVIKKINEQKLYCNDVLCGGEY